MTTGEMLGFTNRFKEILATSSIFKNARLTILMTDLEMAYEIPVFNNIDFNNSNPQIIQLYQTVSNARSV